MYSTLRMALQYMIVGQAAGAAKMAIDGGKAVQDFDTARLHQTLREQGATMEYTPNAADAAFWNRLRAKMMSRRPRIQ